MAAPSIRNMHWTVDMRERLIEEDARRFRNRARMGELVNELKELDPSGWESWYDENIPDWADWLLAPLPMMEQRVNELKSRGSL